MAPLGLSARREFERRQRRESVLNTLAREDVARRDRSGSSEGKLAEEAQAVAFAAGRIVKEPEAAAYNSVFGGLIGEAEARSNVWIIGPHARSGAHAIAPGDVDLGGLEIEVGPAVRHFARRAEIIPAHARD